MNEDFDESMTRRENILVRAARAGLPTGEQICSLFSSGELLPDDITDEQIKVMVLYILNFNGIVAWDGEAVEQLTETYINLYKKYRVLQTKMVLIESLIRTNVIDE